MAEPALRRMSLDDFLTWEDGTDTRYELVDGFVVAMSPPAANQGELVMRIGSRLSAAVSGRPPCRAISEAGIIQADAADSFFVADIAVTCEPRVPHQQYVKTPILIVEVLSPSTAVHDRGFKLPVYREIETIQDVVLVGSTTRYVELHRRSGEQWITELLHGDQSTIRATSVGIQIPLAELYEGIVLDEQLAG